MRGEKEHRPGGWWINVKSKIKTAGTLNMVLIVVGVFFLWFNWQMLEIYRACGSIPETYACAVIAATIGECGICGWIRTTKDRRQEQEERKQAEESAESKESEENAG